MMQYQNLVRVAFKSILKNRLRSLLTSLGIIIGVSAVIIMVAIGEGTQLQIEGQISSLGTNLIIIFPGTSFSMGVSRGAGSFSQLTLEDTEKLKQDARFISGVSPIVMVGGQVIGGSKNWSTTVRGVSSDYENIRSWKLKAGEFFNDRDVNFRKKVAVLGKRVSDNLFPGQNPLGKQIRIRNIPFKVIGVLDEKGQSALGQDEDDVVLAPCTTVLYQLKGGRYINMINASAASQDHIDQAQDEIRSILRKSHRLEQGEDDDFSIRSQAEITQTAAEISKVLTLFLGSIAAVSLVVGGIGIMNIMLVSVTERTREIGIRLSIGARSSDILIQFLIESVALSLTGGIIGITFSLGMCTILNRFTELHTYINPGIVFLAFTFAGAVGIFFGFYPARKASSLNPIDALRYE